MDLDDKTLKAVSLLHKSLLALVAVLSFSLAHPMSALAASADYPQTYVLYMDLGKEAMDHRQYTDAIQYFQYAHLLYPDSQEPLSYINLVQRLQQGRLEVAAPVGAVSTTPKSWRPVIKAKESSVADKVGMFSRTRDQAVAGALDRFEVERQKELETPAPSGKPSRMPTERKRVEETEEPSLGKVIVTEKTSPLLKGPEVIYLNDALLASQPKTFLRVELNTSVVLEGRNIDRFLIITPDFIEVERIDRDRLSVKALRRGSTFLHVWDDTGRWTLNVEVIFPVKVTVVRVKEKLAQQMAEPFEVNYSADWNSFYRGQDMTSMERDTLNLIQRISTIGETPYGDFDGSVIYNKFDESTELTGYTAGLSNGHIGDFRDFNIRGGDITKAFSPLSVPGQYIRGGLLESKAFDKNIEYTYIHGKDRETFGFLSPGVLNERKSFVEAVQVTVFPEKENKYSFNFARGYGEARRPFLKDKVFSLEAQHRIDKALLNGEVAYDEDSLAQTASTHYKGGNYDLRVGVRNIDKGFTTITSLPANRGEVGGIISGDWRLKHFTVDSSLDVYRDRFLPNPEDPEALNFDFNSSVDVPVAQNDRWRTSLYYIDTPGEFSPRDNLRLMTHYSKKFPWWKGRDLNAFAGATYQRSRFDLSPSSEYDRYSLSSGISFYLIKNLNYFLNYEYSLVDETLSGDNLRPYVMNTGLNYTRSLTEAWSMNSALTYRNEENTNGLNSFLAGEDSLTGSLGATFRPSDDFELFTDGRLRNVWAEGSDNTAFNEFDVRGGVRMSWETPFSWNPKGVVEGSVFEDSNANRKQDEGEKGIRDVRVKVGNRELTTNQDGHYETTIRAKRVQVAVAIESIPEGYVFSTPVSDEVSIIPQKKQRVDFGLTTHSSVYGVVFFDKNQNGRPDTGDEFVSRAKMILDDLEATISDFEGTYFFRDIRAGKHTIRIDLNSLPIEFLPLIKLRNEIEVAEGTTYIFHVPLRKAGPAAQGSAQSLEATENPEPEED